jgi:hypothetical protein
MGTAPYTVVTPNETVITQNVVLQGSIHAGGNVRVCAGAGVLGNIFSEGNILLEEGCFVLGNIFSQDKIEIEPNVLIGKKGTVISVVSRGKISIKENVVVYGYISSESGGIISPLYNDYDRRHDNNYSFVSYKEDRLDVSFDDPDEFELVSEDAYRMNKFLHSMFVPDGTEIIKRSMFCGCTGLESFRIPNSLKEIEDFALYNCRSLKALNSFRDSGLVRIGVSGMENCSEIEKLEFPQSLETLDAASCAGMSSLVRITFAEGCRLKTINDHAFRDCSKVVEMVLPDLVEHVGISAFRGCLALKHLSVPKATANEPGILELSEILPDLEVEYRE